MYSEILKWLALASGFVNAIAFTPQLWRIYERQSSDDISLGMLSLFSVVLFINVLRLFDRKDYWLGSGLAASWVMCVTTLVAAYWYR